jgi:hypothetical protein
MERAAAFAVPRFPIPYSPFPASHTAAAPPTISEISCVIAAWRALL